MTKFYRQIVLILLAAYATSLRAQEPDSVRYQNEIMRLNDSIVVLNETIRLLNAELEKAEPLVERQLDVMSTIPAKEWLNKSFSEIDNEKFQTELKLYESFKDRDAIVEAYKEMSSFGKDYSLYLKGVEAINKAYQADLVSVLVDAIKALKEREKHVGRKAELEQLYEQLGYYPFTVMYCQDIINEIDEMLASFKSEGTDKSAWKQIRMFLEEKDEGQVEPAMNKIPWLGVQYHDYLRQLESDPYGANSARDSIMNIVL